VRWQWGETETGGIWSMLVDGGMVLVMGQDAGVLPAIVRGSSGTALGIV
jgi:hypothetical protein